MTGQPRRSVSPVDQQANLIADLVTRLQAVERLAHRHDDRRYVGTTAQRPTAAAAGVGGPYYDTTLSKPIWSDGTTWRDAAGTAV